MVMLTPQLRYVPETDAKLLCRGLSLKYEGNAFRGWTRSYCCSVGMLCGSSVSFGRCRFTVHSCTIASQPSCSTFTVVPVLNLLLLSGVSL